MQVDVSFGTNAVMDVTNAVTSVNGAATTATKIDDL